MRGRFERLTFLLFSLAILLSGNVLAEYNEVFAISVNKYADFDDLANYPFPSCAGMVNGFIVFDKEMSILPPENLGDRTTFTTTYSPMFNTHEDECIASTYIRFVDNLEMGMAVGGYLYVTQSTSLRMAMQLSNRQAACGDSSKYTDGRIAYAIYPVVDELPDFNGYTSFVTSSPATAFTPYSYCDDSGWSTATDWSATKLYSLTTLSPGIYFIIIGIALDGPNEDTRQEQLIFNIGTLTNTPYQTATNTDDSDSKLKINYIKQPTYAFTNRLLDFQTFQDQFGEIFDDSPVFCEEIIGTDAYLSSVPDAQRRCCGDEWNDNGYTYGNYECVMIALGQGYWANYVDDNGILNYCEDQNSGEASYQSLLGSSLGVTVQDIDTIRGGTDACCGDDPYVCDYIETDPLGTCYLGCGENGYVMPEYTGYYTNTYGCRADAPDACVTKNPCLGAYSCPATGAYGEECNNIPGCWYSPYRCYDSGNYHDPYDCLFMTESYGCGYSYNSGCIEGRELLHTVDGADVYLDICSGEGVPCSIWEYRTPDGYGGYYSSGCTSEAPAGFCYNGGTGQCQGVVPCSYYTDRMSGGCQQPLPSNVQYGIFAQCSSMPIAQEYCDPDNEYTHSSPTTKVYCEETLGGRWAAAVNCQSLSPEACALQPAYCRISGAGMDQGYVSSLTVDGAAQRQFLCNNDLDGRFSDARYSIDYGDITAELRWKWWDAAADGQSFLLHLAGGYDVMSNGENWHYCDAYDAATDATNKGVRLGNQETLPSKSVSVDDAPAGSILCPVPSLFEYHPAKPDDHNWANFIFANEGVCSQITTSPFSGLDDIQQDLTSKYIAILRNYANYGFTGSLTQEKLAEATALARGFVGCCEYYPGFGTISPFDFMDYVTYSLTESSAVCDLRFKCYYDALHSSISDPESTPTIIDPSTSTSTEPKEDSNDWDGTITSYVATCEEVGDLLAKPTETCAANDLCAPLTSDGSYYVTAQRDASDPDEWCCVNGNCVTPPPSTGTTTLNCSDLGGAGEQHIIPSAFANDFECRNEPKTGYRTADGICCIGPVDPIFKNPDEDTPDSPYIFNPEAYLCYKGINGQAMIAECCDEQTCFNGLTWSINKLDKDNGRVFTEGSELYTVLSFDAEALSDYTGMRDYVKERTITNQIAFINNIHTISDLSIDPNNQDWSRFNELTFNIGIQGPARIETATLQLTDGTWRTFTLSDHATIPSLPPNMWHRVSLPLSGITPAQRQVTRIDITVRSTGAVSTASPITIKMDNFALHSTDPSMPNKYCTGSYRSWISSLDLIDEDLNGEYSAEEYGKPMVACNAQLSSTWTGTQCCGDETTRIDYDSNDYTTAEFYVDNAVEGLGISTKAACWAGRPVYDDHVIPESFGNNPEFWPYILYFNASFWSCYQPMDFTDVSGTSWRTGTNIKLSSPFAVAGSWYCDVEPPGHVEPLTQPTKMWRKTADCEAWTGTQCCGRWSDEENLTDDDPSESYAHYEFYTDTNAACWAGKTVPNATQGITVARALRNESLWPYILYYDHEFWSCNKNISFTDISQDIWLTPTTINRVAPGVVVGDWYCGFETVPEPRWVARPARGDEVCDDGMDNDLDNYTDFEDADCYNNPDEQWSMHPELEEISEPGKFALSTGVPTWWRPNIFGAADAICGDDNETSCLPIASPCRTYAENNGGNCPEEMGCEQRIIDSMTLCFEKDGLFLPDCSWRTQTECALGGMCYWPANTGDAGSTLPLPTHRYLCNKDFLEDQGDESLGEVDYTFKADADWHWWDAVETPYILHFINGSAQFYDYISNGQGWYYCDATATASNGNLVSEYGTFPLIGGGGTGPIIPNVCSDRPADFAYITGEPEWANYIIVDTQEDYDMVDTYPSIIYGRYVDAVSTGLTSERRQAIIDGFIGACYSEEYFDGVTKDYATYFSATTAYCGSIQCKHDRDNQGSTSDDDGGTVITPSTDTYRDKKDATTFDTFIPNSAVLTCDQIAFNYQTFNNACDYNQGQICVGGKRVTAARNEQCCIGGECQDPDVTITCEEAAEGNAYTLIAPDDIYNECVDEGDIIETADEGTCCVGEVALREEDLVANLFYDNLGFICYQGLGGKSFFGECCSGTTCKNSASWMLMSGIGESPDNGRIFTSGSQLHTILSFDQWTDEGMIDRVREFSITPESSRTSYLRQLRVPPTFKGDWSMYDSLSFDMGYTGPLTIESFIIDGDNDPTNGYLFQGSVSDYAVIPGLPQNMWQHVIIDLPEYWSATPASFFINITNPNGASGGLFILRLDNFILHPRQEAASVSTQQRYCSGAYGLWLENLDLYEYNGEGNDFDPANIRAYGPPMEACNAQLSSRWTGTQCCGADTQLISLVDMRRAEFYNDTMAGCWAGVPVNHGQTVSQAFGGNADYWPHILYYKGEFWSCDKDLLFVDIDNNLHATIPQEAPDDYYYVLTNTMQAPSATGYAACDCQDARTSGNDCGGYFTVGVDESSPCVEYYTAQSPSGELLDYVDIYERIDHRINLASPFAIIDEWYCEGDEVSPSWRALDDLKTSRLLATKLYELANPEDFTLHCDDFSKASPFPGTSLNSLGTVAFTHAPATACVLRSTDEEGVERVSLGFPVAKEHVNGFLNESIRGFREVLYPDAGTDMDVDVDYPDCSLTVDGQSMPTTITGDEFFLECQNEEEALFVRYNAALGLLIVSRDEEPTTGFLQSIWEAITGFFRNLFGMSDDSPLPTINLPSIMEADFDYFYMSRKGDTEVKGVINKGYYENDPYWYLRVDYENLSTDIRPLYDAYLDAYPVLQDADKKLCQLSNTQSVFITFDTENTNIERTFDWRYLTSNLRLQDLNPAADFAGSGSCSSLHDGVLDEGEECDDDWDLGAINVAVVYDEERYPEGPLCPGDPEREQACIDGRLDDSVCYQRYVLYVTKDVYTGDLLGVNPGAPSGRASADRICAEEFYEHAPPQLSSRLVTEGSAIQAVLSDASTNAKDLFNPAMDVYNTYGQLIANAGSMFNDFGFPSGVSVYEVDNNYPYNELFAWTGSNNFGYASNTCEGWTTSEYDPSLQGMHGTIGPQIMIDGQWLYLRYMSCSDVARLYCMATLAPPSEEVLPPSPPPSTSPPSFTTTSIPDFLVGEHYDFNISTTGCEAGCDWQLIGSYERREGSEEWTSADLPFDLTFSEGRIYHPDASYRFPTYEEYDVTVLPTEFRIDVQASNDYGSSSASFYATYTED